MMKPMSMLAGIALAAVCAAGPATAVTLSFPGVGTDWLSQTNGTGTLAGGDQTDYMWTTGDYVRQSFADTGLAQATSITGRYTIENILGTTDLLVDVYVNGNAVGQFTILACGFCTEIQSFGYAFSFAGIAGDDYDLEFRLANTIPGGDGSIAWLDGGVAELEGIIPEPASWALMIAGFGLVGTALRRRTRALIA